MDCGIVDYGVVFCTAAIDEVRQLEVAAEGRIYLAKVPRKRYDYTLPKNIATKMRKALKQNGGEELSTFQ